MHEFQHFLAHALGVCGDGHVSLLWLVAHSDVRTLVDALRMFVSRP